MKKENNYRLIIVSPFIILLVNFFVSQILFSFMGNWSWTVVLPIYYCQISVIIFLLGEEKNYKEWFKKSEGSIIWRIICVIFFSVFSLPVFFTNISRLDSLIVIILSIIYSIINPFFEEVFWRRILLSNLKMNKIIAVLFSSLLFTINHPLTLFKLNRIFCEPGFLIITFLYGLVWSITYLKTKSLRCNYFTHVMVNFASLSILVFLNRYVPVFSM